MIELMKTTTDGIFITLSIYTSKGCYWQRLWFPYCLFAGAGACGRALAAEWSQSRRSNAKWGVTNRYVPIKYILN